MARETTIFVVDDDPAIRDSLKLLLESHGLAVKDFASASQLLQDGAPRPTDCLVCDVHMPAMSGIDLIAKLTSRGLTLPTILISGRADEGLRRRALAAGAFLLMEKPFDGNVLVDAIDRAVAAGTAQP
jgi:FixJ family two-component response regulator